MNEELIGLSFFDERLSHETKRDMVNSLKRQGSTNPSTRLTIDVTDLSLQEKKLSFFITSTTRNFFTKLGLPMGFLNEDPADWSNNDDYIIGKNYVKDINVVNDNAERGVALINNFSGHLTKNEKQLQYLLQFVKLHRHKFSELTKSSIKESLKSLQNNK